MSLCITSREANQDSFPSEWQSWVMVFRCLWAHCGKVVLSWWCLKVSFLVSSPAPYPNPQRIPKEIPSVKAVLSQAFQFARKKTAFVVPHYNLHCSQMMLEDTGILYYIRCKTLKWLSSICMDKEKKRWKWVLLHWERQNTFHTPTTYITFTYFSQPYHFLASVRMCLFKSRVCLLLTSLCR